MQDSPDWQYDEFHGFALDFHDPVQVKLYDGQQGTDLDAESQIVRFLGISEKDTLIEYGAGTGAFVEAAARVCRHVHAVDVSRAMIEYASERLGKIGVANVTFHHAGFLTYEHRDAPVSFVVAKFALHHLPDFWKIVALGRINRFLQLGGGFYLEDVVFSFQPESYNTAIQQWIDRASESGISFSKKDFEGHVRDEYSTYSWMMEAMIQRAGFAIRNSEFLSPTIATYLCEKVE
ncbi:MAG: class I SAM-dependent methyltransferase [Chthoniobacterales bacterium]